MKKKILTVIISGLILGALTGCGKETSAATANSDLRVLNQAVMTGNVDHYAAIVGVEQKIFEKHGIDLKMTEYVMGINTIDAIVNGTADIGNMADYATVNRLGNTLHDTDLKIFSQLSGGKIENGGLYVAEKYADDISELDGSEGFLTITGTVQDYYAIKAIDYLGLDEKKQNLLNSDSAQTQLALVQQNAASAIYTSGANADKVEEYGWKRIATSEELGIETGAYLLATDKYIASNKELLADYLEALEETFEYMKENSDDAAKIVAGKTGAEVADVRSNIDQYNLTIGLLEEGYEHLQEINEWAYEHNRFSEEYDIKDFYDTSVLEVKRPELITFH